MKIHTKTLIRELSKIEGGVKTGVEVGVWRGHNAYQLLEAFPDLHLTLVDDYGSGHVVHSKLTRYFTPSEAKEEAYRLLRSYKHRIRWLIHLSTEAAKRVDDGSFDFVFADAGLGHSKEGTLIDIEAWILKVRSGGLFLGHDYEKRGHKCKGVKQAVDEYFGDRVNVAGNVSRIWWVHV